MLIIIEITRNNDRLIDNLSSKKQGKIHRYSQWYVVLKECSVQRKNKKL